MTETSNATIWMCLVLCVCDNGGHLLASHHIKIDKKGVTCMFGGCLETFKRRVIAHRRVRVTGLIGQSECCFHRAKMILYCMWLSLSDVTETLALVCVNVVVDLTVRLVSVFECVCDI